MAGTASPQNNKPQKNLIDPTTLEQAYNWPSYPVNDAIIPPKDAILAAGSFYRLVNTCAPQSSCFQSTHEEQPNRYKRLNGDDRVNVFGASFFDNRESAVHVRAAFPEMLGEKIIAFGELKNYMGEMKKTRGPSHYTVWLRLDTDIHEHFNCVEDAQSE